jgi:hypothetical protein
LANVFFLWDRLNLFFYWWGRGGLGVLLLKTYHPQAVIIEHSLSKLNQGSAWT